MKNAIRDLRLGIVLAALVPLALGGCGDRASSDDAAQAGAQSAAGAQGPDLASCPRDVDGTPSELKRTAPLAIPEALSGIAASDFAHIAVSTLSGGTVCVDTSWIESIRKMVLSPDKRFVSFEWYGYEQYGYKLVDRSGKGEVVETGVKPDRSPSGKLIASLEYSESGFGPLNALGIWRISVKPAVQVAIAQLPEGLTDWRFDGWKSDDCLAASASTFEQLGDDGINHDEATRKRFVSRQSNDWKLEPAGKTGCKAS